MNVGKEETGPPRSWYVKAGLIDLYGPTTGCPGCRTKRDSSKRAQAHNAECRARIWTKLLGDPSRRDIVEKEEARMDRHFEKAMRREIEKNKELKESERMHEEYLEETKDRIKRARITGDPTPAAAVIIINGGIFIIIILITSGTDLWFQNPARTRSTPNPTSTQ